MWPISITGSWFSWTTIRNLRNAKQFIVIENILIPVRNTGEMDSWWFSRITFWYLYYPMNKWEVIDLHWKHYTYRMQWRGVRNLNFMDQIQIHIIYITNTDRLYFNATNWKCIKLWRVIKHKMSRKSSYSKVWFYCWCFFFLSCCWSMIVCVY